MGIRHARDFARTRPSRFSACNIEIARSGLACEATRHMHLPGKTHLVLYALNLAICMVFIITLGANRIQFIFTARMNFLV